jgi:hypothetical protein
VRQVDQAEGELLVTTDGFAACSRHRPY